MARTKKTESVMEMDFTRYYYGLEVDLTLIEPMLGMRPQDDKILDNYIASQAPDAASREEEIAAKGITGVTDTMTTVFPRDANGNPFLWDYQLRGMCKDSCGLLAKDASTRSSTLHAYKKAVDGRIFVLERRIPLILPEGVTELGWLQRPLRASTPQGERQALAKSEVAPEGTKLHFTYICLVRGDLQYVKEWLRYGRWHGLGQWRNSGCGRFTWTGKEVFFKDDDMGNMVPISEKDLPKPKKAADDAANEE